MIYFFDDSSDKSIPSIETYFCQITQIDAKNLAVSGKFISTKGKVK